AAGHAAIVPSPMATAELAMSWRMSVLFGFLCKLTWLLPRLGGAPSERLGLRCCVRRSVLIASGGQSRAGRARSCTRSRHGGEDHRMPTGDVDRIAIVASRKVARGRADFEHSSVRVIPGIRTEG